LLKLLINNSGTSVKHGVLSSALYYANVTMWQIFSGVCRLNFKTVLGIGKHSISNIVR